MAKKPTTVEAAPGGSGNPAGTTVNVHPAAPAAAKAAVKKTTRPRWSYVSFISKWRSFSWSLVKVAIAILILVIAWFAWKIGQRVYVLIDRNLESSSYAAVVVSEQPVVPPPVQVEEDPAVTKVRRENAEIISRLQQALNASIAESTKTREALENARKEFQAVLKPEASVPCQEQMVVTRIEPSTVIREVPVGPRLVAVKGSWQTIELAAGERSRRFCVQKEISQGKVSIMSRTPGLKAELEIGGAGVIPRFMGRSQRVSLAIPVDQDEIEIPPDAKGVWFYWEAEEGKPTDGKPLVIKIRE